MNYTHFCQQPIDVQLKRIADLRKLYVPKQYIPIRSYCELYFNMESDKYHGLPEVNTAMDISSMLKRTAPREYPEPTIRHWADSYRITDEQLIMLLSLLAPIRKTESGLVKTTRDISDSQILLVH